jgi:hypothetical protein
MTMRRRMRILILLKLPPKRLLKHPPNPKRTLTRTKMQRMRLKKWMSGKR